MRGNRIRVEELIDEIEHRFEKFFDINPFPDSKESSKLLKDLEQNIRDINIKLKQLSSFCDKDQLRDSIKSADDLKYLIDGSLSEYIDKQLAINYKYVNAYADLKALLVEILNNEEVDLTKYSTKISKETYEAFVRKNKLIDLNNEL